MTDYVEILPDISEDITHWICRGLNTGESWIGKHITYGFALGNKMLGGLIFNDLRFNHDVWWTIYAEDKRWCNRNVLRKMFAAAFIDMRCRRINVLVETDNLKSINLVKRLGFKQEGLLRQYTENGHDCYLFGMLKQECPWLKMKGKENE